MLDLQYIFDHWHEIAYSALALLVIAAYVSHFFHSEGVLAKFIKPENLLIIVLLFVMVIATRMESLGGALDTKMDEVSGRIFILSKLAGYAKFEILKDTDKMFVELLRSLRETHSEVHVTSIRSEPPEFFKSQSPLAQVWYKELVEWADKAPGRRLYRVIGTPNNQMKAWFTKECAARKRTDNYILRSMNWDENIPIMNVVVFDRKEAFLVFSPPKGPLAETEILHILDSDSSNLVVERYFKNIMEETSPCAEPGSSQRRKSL
jgi:hypothetical protein